MGRDGSPGTGLSAGTRLDADFGCRLLAMAVAATAFRRGDGWSWWALLVGNTIAFVSAMTYDWTVGAIGPFELTEYLGLALIWGALALKAPFRAAGRPVPSPRL